MDLYTELQELLGALGRARVPYALCGGLALAVYGIVRATEDIDLLVEGNALDALRSVAETRGFRFDKRPLRLMNGQVVVERMVKLDPHAEDFIVLDLLLVTPIMGEAWATRREVDTAFGPIWVVSAPGLIQLKELRGSGQDVEDIRRLREGCDAT